MLIIHHTYDHIWRMAYSCRLLLTLQWVAERTAHTTQRTMYGKDESEDEGR